MKPLHTFSKILERIIYNRFYKYLSEKNILIKEQFGFRPSFSTETALLHALEQITAALERKEIPLAIYVDLSKAFDSLDHNILLRKLEHYGIRGVLHNWFESYLSDRKQYTSFKGTKSDILPITCGVPQGSILGPLLFLVYVNDIVNTSNLLRFVMYADDINIFVSHPDEIVLNTIVNNELQNICDWFKANKLQINASKTKYMIFQSSKTRLSHSDMTINLGSNAISRVTSISFLGVIIDEKLSWKNHVNYIHGKISSSIGMMYKLRTVLPKKTLFMLYNALVLPYLDYCNLIWSAAIESDLNRLAILQKKAIRLCTNSHYLAHTPPLFKELNTLFVRDRILFKLGLFMYKHVNSLLPSIFNDYFTTHFMKHSLNTRNKQNFVLPFCRLKVTQLNSIKYKGAKIWNTLVNNLKCTSFMNCFKSTLKQQFLNTYK